MIEKYGNVEKYLKLLDESKKIYVILQNYYGGSFKYLNDIIKTYSNNYVIVSELNQLDNIKNNDIVVVNYCDDTYINKLVKEKRK